jgi:hypothetical protein
VHFKATAVSYRKVRMDETETLLFIPGDTFNGCKSYCFGFIVSRPFMRTYAACSADVLYRCPQTKQSILGASIRLCTNGSPVILEPMQRTSVSFL